MPVKSTASYGHSVHGKRSRDFGKRTTIAVRLAEPAVYQYKLLPRARAVNTSSGSA
jgi:hypothetical protein